MVTTGALGAIYCICMNFAGPGDEILMFEPYFTIYANIIDFSGAKIVTCPMVTSQDGQWHFDFESFEKAINEKTKLLILNNPHNPTGRVFTSDEMAKISEILDRHPHVKVLSDEVYFHCTFDGRPHLSFANYSESNWEKTISVFSGGKLLNCTGWKVGWAIGPANLIRQALFVQESIAFNANVPGQIAIAKSMK